MSITSIKYESLLHFAKNLLQGSSDLYKGGRWDCKLKAVNEYDIQKNISNAQNVPAIYKNV